MHQSPQFHGTQLDKDAFLDALSHNCTCEHDGDTGALVLVCAGHRAFVSDQTYINHMEFGRSLAARLWAQEWAVQPTEEPAHALD